jgi:hypothetical protein
MKRLSLRKTKTLKKQKGGFYPTVMEGVRSAGVLSFLAARQAYRLWNNSKLTTRKSKK